MYVASGYINIIILHVVVWNAIVTTRGTIIWHMSMLSAISCFRVSVIFILLYIYIHLIKSHISLEQCNNVIILHFVECNIIFIAQWKIILHEAILSAIKMLLYETKCNINLIICISCLFLIRKSTNSKSKFWNELCPLYVHLLCLQ